MVLVQLPFNEPQNPIRIIEVLTVSNVVWNHGLFQTRDKVSEPGLILGTPKPAEPVAWSLGLRVYTSLVWEVWLTSGN